MVEQQAKNETIDTIAVREELDRLLASQTFRRATRMRELVDYIVKGTLEGGTITEAKAARDVFQKGENFDASIDPEVRIHYGRLRRKLAEYYATEGKDSTVLIDLPARQYGPVFLPHTPSAEKQMEADNVVSMPGPTQSIAVLPFANFTNDPVQDVFCYGLTEEIITNLASELSSVNVVASSSAFQFKDKPVDVREAGLELGVQMILEGSVRMEENHTRVTVRLARVNDGIAIWSDSFDASGDGALTTQQGVARQIIERLPVELGASAA